MLGSALATLVSVPNIARKRPNPGLRASGVVLMLHRPVPIARAQTAIGGDVDFLIPWVTYVGGPTTNIAEDSVIGFPIGITIKGQASMALNTELLPRSWRFMWRARGEQRIHLNWLSEANDQGRAAY